MPMPPTKIKELRAAFDQWCNELDAAEAERAEVLAINARLVEENQQLTALRANKVADVLREAIQGATVTIQKEAAQRIAELEKRNAELEKTIEKLRCERAGFAPRTRRMNTGG